MELIKPIFVLSAVLAVAPPALAQPRPSHAVDYGDDEVALSLGVDVGWNAGELRAADLQVLSTTLSVGVAFDEFELSVDWPLVYLDLSGAESDSTLVSGNPFAAAYLVKRSDHGMFRIGLGMALPVANIEESAGGLFGIGEELGLESTAYAYARAIRGSWDAWLYYPEQFAFVVPAALEGQSGALVLGAEGAAALLVPIDSAVDDTTDLVFQAAGSAALRAGMLTAGLRLQAVWGPTSDGDAQLAGVPFAQVDFSDDAFVDARFLLNLDEPLGFFGDGSELWGIFLGAGGRL